MSVSNYSKTCSYSVGQLEPYVWMCNEEEIDKAKIVNLDDGLVSVDCSNVSFVKAKCLSATFNEEQSLNERHKFDKKLTFSLVGHYQVYDLDKWKFFVVKDKKGEYYAINLDFAAHMEYTYTLDNTQNNTSFTFTIGSNIPTLLAKNVSESNIVDGSDCSYNVGGVKSLRLLENYKATLDNKNGKFITTDAPKKVDFNKSSLTFTEQYDGNGKLTDTLKFVIDFPTDQGTKLSWQYNLIEFLDNKYVAIIEPYTPTRKTIYSGFNFGLQPSFVLQTSEDASEGNTCTITMVEMSNFGATASNSFVLDENSESTFENVAGAKGNGSHNDSFVLCLDEPDSEGKNAFFILQEEYNALGNPTGKYKVRQGYESYITDSEIKNNIIGTFDDNLHTYSQSCVAWSMCAKDTDMPLKLEFNEKGCKTYSFESECDWSFTNIPSWLTITPSKGVGGSTYTIEVCSTNDPKTDGTKNDTIELDNGGTKTPVDATSVPNYGWINPKKVDINCTAQYVTFNTNGTGTIKVTSNPSNLNYTIGTNNIKFQVPANTSTANTRTFNIEVTRGDETQPLTINQDKTYEKWVEGTNGEYVCDGTASYKVLKRYTGTTSSNVNTLTSETKKGSLISSTDNRCSNVSTRWADNGLFTCQNGDKYKLLEEEVSYDGTNWTKTGNVKVGSLVESNSSYCSESTQYQWVLTNQSQCNTSQNAKPNPINPDDGGGSWDDEDVTPTYIYDTKGVGHSLNIVGEITQSSYTGEVATSAIDQLIIGNQVTSIGANAFELASSMTQVTIPNSVTSIGSYAFNKCSHLTEVTIPVSVTTLKRNIFTNCTRLAKAYYTGTIAQWDELYQRTLDTSGLPFDISFKYIQCSDGEYQLIYEG